MMAGCILVAILSSLGGHVEVDLVWGLNSGFELGLGIAPFE